MQGSIYEINLTEKEIFKIVLNSWASIESISEFNDILYANLFQKDESILDVFEGIINVYLCNDYLDTNLDYQKAQFGNMIEKIIRLLNSPCEFDTIISGLGKRHSLYEIKPKHFVVFGSSLIAALKLCLGNKFSFDVESSWISFYSMLS